MKKHTNLSLEELERKEMDSDPLEKLDIKRTITLESFFSVPPEEDNNYSARLKDPEYQAVEEFLSSKE